MLGRAVFTGSAPTTGAVATELAGLLAPPALMAVSSARSACPTSPAAGAYVCPVAPMIG